MGDSSIIREELIASSLNGITAIFWVIIGSVVGFLLISKYFKYKDKILLLVGINIMILPSPWWPATSGYVLALFGIYLDDILYGILLLGPLTIDILIWVYVVSEALYKEKQKIIMALMLIYTVACEIIIISLSIINVNAYIMIRLGLIDIRFQLPLMIINILHSIIFITTLILYALPILRSSIPETRLKGKFAISFLILFMIGNILDAIIPWDVILGNAQLILIAEAWVALFARIILIGAILCLYNVFLLPEWLKNKLLG